MKKLKHLKPFNESIDNYFEELKTLISSGTPNWEIMDFLRDKLDYVPDGVWDISDIDFIELSLSYITVGGGRWRNPTAEELSEHSYKVLEFLTKYPNSVVADAYQTEHPFLLATKPTIKVDYIGSGFNHGSNNIIDNCPKRILICGEDD